MPNHEINSNHEIATQKQKGKFFSLPQGFEPWFRGTEKQCATNEFTLSTMLM